LRRERIGIGVDALPLIGSGRNHEVGIAVQHSMVRVGLESRLRPRESAVQRFRQARRTPTRGRAVEVRRAASLPSFAPALTLHRCGGYIPRAKAGCCT
jgi:hypothetical protein